MHCLNKIPIGSGAYAAATPVARLVVASPRDLALGVPRSGSAPCFRKICLEKHVVRRANPFDSLKKMFLGEGPDDEDAASMVRIDSDTRGITGEKAFGPFAILVIGFMPDEFAVVQELMVEMEATDVQLIACTQEMMLGSLGQALESGCNTYVQPPLGQRRAVFLSGMYGSEIIEVVSAFKDKGLSCVFAAAVPNNYNRDVQSLVEEVYADHNAMMRRQATAGAEGSIE